MKKYSFIPSIIFFLLACSGALSQKPLVFRDTTISGPQTFAFIVGVSKYKHIRPLSYADKDALLFREFLKSPAGGNLNDDNIFFLLNEQVNNANFWSKGFQWIRAKNLQKGDRLFIYMAGHGDAIDEDQFFFLGYDCNPGSDKNNYLVGGAIQLFNLKKKIANETAKGVEVFFIMDACRSNELPGGMPGLNFLNTAITEKKAGEAIMLATAAGQESLEHASIGSGHGLFTYYLIDGLAGMADSVGTPDKKITFGELQDYVKQNVPAVAQTKFNRRQEPYFCCEEKNNTVISRVDTDFLNNWLKRKKESAPLPGKAISDVLNPKNAVVAADTSVKNLYDRFYKAVKEKKLTGPASAEFYFDQMNNIAAKSPYTLDARSTLEAAFISHAQHLISKYIDCGVFSKKQKQENFEAGQNLEKAIALVQHDEPEFAASLTGRMYFLKASGDFSKNNLHEAFQYAYAALVAEPDAAYITNLLARLHLENKQTDSALHYARRAVQKTPSWPCAAATLALAEQALKNKKSGEPGKEGTVKKGSFGFTAGGGMNRSNPTYSGNMQTNYVGVEAASAPSLNLGVAYQLRLGHTIFIRPVATTGYEQTDILFQRRPAVGGEVIIETVSVKGASLNLSVPLIIPFSKGRAIPYFVAGPSFHYLLGQNSASAERLPVMKSLFSGQAGLGIDIPLYKTGFYISPELKYAAGFSELKDDAGHSPYMAALSSLKRNSFTLGLYLRKR